MAQDKVFVSSLAITTLDGFPEQINLVVDLTTGSVEALGSDDELYAPLSAENIKKREARDKVALDKENGTYVDPSDSRNADASYQDFLQWKASQNTPAAPANSNVPTAPSDVVNSPVVNPATPVTPPAPVDSSSVNTPPALPVDVAPIPVQTPTSDTPAATFVPDSTPDVSTTPNDGTNV